ncbi:unnamed protein product [Parnassius apollo]|uniref:(apollo) hypothetical protein n=1 Tax=Parnassius apollo TaxID=110799 RepID=A0A8S3X6P2_PARAO|nr:unnamed protein product [Parnassius apollo]
MVYEKCCVGGCNTTRETHRLFRFPRNDNLRNLWMSFIVPTNPQLIVLSKEQLLNKRVCERHFDIFQFGNEGRRLRYSYPSFLTDNEIAYGVPLTATGGSMSIPKPYEARDKIQFTPVYHIDIWPVECDIENYCKDNIFDLECVKVEEENFEYENSKFEVNGNHDKEQLCIQTNNFSKPCRKF